MPRCTRTFVYILLLDFLLFISLPVSYIFLGPFMVQFIVLALLLVVPLLTLRDAGNTVGWMAESGSHKVAPALTRLACGASVAFLFFSSVLQAFQGQQQIPFVVGLFLFYCVIQQFRLVGGMAVNLLLCLGAPFYCRSRADWQWTLGCLATSLAGVWVMQRPRPEFVNPALAGVMNDLFNAEYLFIVGWCLSSFVYGLMWGGCLQYFLQKSFRGSR